jgi:hypothetical protein
MKKGFKFAAIHNGQYCFGSNSSPLSQGNLTASQCDAACAETNQCGGKSTANSVYRLPERGDFKDIGCMSKNTIDYNSPYNLTMV